jgi:hypothetical protein
MEDAKKPEDLEVGQENLQTETTPVSEDVKTEAPKDEIDWKARFEETDRELTQAKFTLKNKNIKAKKVEEPDSEETDEEVQDLPKDMIEKMVDERVEAAQLSMRADIIAEELEKMSQNPDEQKVIQLFYENKIVKTGYDRSSIKKDLEFARLLANKPRLEKVNAEILEKKKSEDAVTTANSSSGQKIDSDSTSSVYLSDADKALMAKYKLKPSDIKS